MNDIKKYKNLIESADEEEIYISNDHAEIEGYVTNTYSERVVNWFTNRHKINPEKTIDYIKENFERISFLNNMNIFDDEDRGKGYGKEIMEQFIDEAYDNGAEIIILYADLQESQEEGFDLVKFYEKYGFDVIERYTDGVLMVLEEG